MNKFFFLLFLTIPFSCHTGAEREKVITNYGIISASFTAFQTVQQDFINKLTNAALAIKADNNAPIDTKELRAFLDSAKQAGSKRLAIIKSTEEADTELKLKQKAIDYVSVFNAAYDKEFSDFINILESNSQNKYEESVKILTPKLLEIKEAGAAFEQASIAVQDKYEVDFSFHKVDPK